MSKKIANRRPRKKKVFQGVIFSVYQWRQQMFDGSYQIFEEIVRPDTTSIIAVVGKKIIVQRQRQPSTKTFISLPGGRIEEGEQPRQAAQRELLEETGYQAGRWLLFKKKKNLAYKLRASHYIYIARDCRRVTPLTLDNGEKIVNQLVSFRQLLALTNDDNFFSPTLKIEFLRLLADKKERKKFYNLLFS